MISPDEALRFVLEYARLVDGCEVVPVEQACGRVLWDDVAADRDIPPFDRVCMDGFAFRHEGLEAGAKLTIIESVRAGFHANRVVAPGQCTAAMTGAPLPPGADTVIPVEDTTVEGETVTLEKLPPLKRHVAHQGSDCREGQTVLPAGSVLTPTAVAVLATVGKETVTVRRHPRIAILSTGDEIVRPSAPVGPDQIRDSNSYSLASQAHLAGFHQITMGHAIDDQAELTALFEDALQADVVIVSGGVSLGTYDLVPSILTKLGVKPHFHMVAQKPARPLWFGSSDTTLVFGAPGNPLATVLTFDRYILAALRKMSGLPTRRPRLQGHLTTDVSAKKGSRDTFFFARAEQNEDGGFELAALSRTGAADVFGTADANAIFRLSPGTVVESGTAVPFNFIGVFEGAF